MEVTNTVGIFAQIFQFTVFFRWKGCNKQILHKLVMLYVRRTDRLESNHKGLGFDYYFISCWYKIR